MHELVTTERVDLLFLGLACIETPPSLQAGRIGGGEVGRQIGKPERTYPRVEGFVEYVLIEHEGR